MQSKAAKESNHDETLIRILEDMLADNVDITARAVARLHPKVKHASTITRNEYRSEVLAKYQAKQIDIRSHIGRIGKRSKEKVASDLADKDRRIAELERQVAMLKASHLAMIRVVGEMGGMGKWAKFFEGYRSIRDELADLNALPLTEFNALRLPKN